ncbi:hypothetical protein [Phaeocystidibacter marisrubri]|uniref:Uncharacterized protein n=1 Tax=Phaeocystidibacter marisrubri TaxID=1577780 RepID=A0A6L3ZF28_9FLAO|nr:hypothetical protein [Phaeocystidibacter marisrubri]KAB2816441.1 hypothetical protein F8C82_12225 [Phaeocystidibacter marisrubri]GGH69067.1 hypothetical protein GCM10011318_09730 [Phaeocystidibacter marisrubri]
MKNRNIFLVSIAIIGLVVFRMWGHKMDAPDSFEDRLRMAKVMELDYNLDSADYWLDSLVEMSPDMQVELLFHFERDFDSTTFDRGSWMYTYRYPKVFQGEYASLHFQSKTLLFKDDSLLFCTDCLDTTALEKREFYHFSSSPTFYGDSLRETHEKHSRIDAQIGQVEVVTHAAQCDDTGRHTVSISTSSGTFRTRREFNLILIESGNCFFIVEYAGCRGVMDIYRVSDNAVKS